MLLSFHFYV